MFRSVGKETNFNLYRGIGETVFLVICCLRGKEVHFTVKLSSAIILGLPEISIRYRPYSCMASAIILHALVQSGRFLGSLRLMLGSSCSLEPSGRPKGW